MKNQSIHNVFLLAVIAFLTLTNSNAYSKEWIVDNSPKTLDSKTYELQVALDFAANGDVILLKNGRYTLDRYSLKKDIEIKGESKNVTIELGGNLYVRKQRLKLSQLNLVAGGTLTVGDMISVTDGGYEADDVSFDCQTSRQVKAVSVHMVEGADREPTSSESRSVAISSEPISEERAAMLAAKGERPPMPLVKSVKIRKMYSKNCFTGLDIFKLGNLPVDVQDLKIENAENFAFLVHQSDHIKFEKVEIIKTAGITVSDSGGSVEQLKVSECPTNPTTGLWVSNSIINISSVDVKNCSGITVNRSSKTTLKNIKLEGIKSIGISVYGNSEASIENIAITGYSEGITVSSNSKVNVNRAEINKIANIAVSVDNSELTFNDSSISDTKSGVAQKNANVSMSNVRISNPQFTGHSCGGDCGSLKANNVTIENFKDIAWFWYKASGMNYSGSGNNPDPIQYQKARSPASSGF